MILPDNWIIAHKDEIFVQGFAETTRQVPVIKKGATFGKSDRIFEQDLIKYKPVISYGISSYGYDLRIAREFKVFTPVHNQAVDPKNISDKCFVDINVPKDKDHLLIPPHSFALGRSVEELQIPDDVLCICLGKSTYARCGIIVNVTPLEPGWRGFVTIEISNTTPLPAKVYVEEGICQILFFKGAGKPTGTYTTKKGGGKYQNQVGVTLPKV